MNAQRLERWAQRSMETQIEIVATESYGSTVRNGSAKRHRGHREIWEYGERDREHRETWEYAER